MLQSRHLASLFLASSLVMTALPALADSGDNLPNDSIGLSVAGKLGTTGYGIELGYRINDHLAVRAGQNIGKLGFKYEDDTNTGYSLGFELNNAPIVLDWHVFGGKFRLSAGYVLNKNGFHDSTTGPAVTVGNNTYATTMTTDVDFGNAALYAGLGWGAAPSTRGGLGFGVDLGVLKQGKPNVRVTAPGASAADIALQEATYAEDMKSLQLWPVIAFTVGYTF